MMLCQMECNGFLYMEKDDSIYALTDHFQRCTGITAAEFSFLLVLAIISMLLQMKFEQFSYIITMHITICNETKKVQRLSRASDFKTYKV